MLDLLIVIGAMWGAFIVACVVLWLFRPIGRKVRTPDTFNRYRGRRRSGYFTTIDHADTD